MYHVFRTKRFEKSYKRINHSGNLKEQAVTNLTEVIEMLKNGKSLIADYKDHQLTGDMK